jgi:hypothetical protein
MVFHRHLSVTTRRRLKVGSPLLTADAWLGVQSKAFASSPGGINPLLQCLDKPL